MRTEELGLCPVHTVPREALEHGRGRDYSGCKRTLGTVNGGCGDQWWFRQEGMKRSLGDRRRQRGDRRMGRRAAAVPDEGEDGARAFLSPASGAPGSRGPRGIPGAPSSG